MIVIQISDLIMIISKRRIQQNRGSKMRSSLCLCTCKNQCLILNPTNGRYEGEGQWVPRSTHHNHIRDDRRRKMQRQIQRSRSVLDRSALMQPPQMADPGNQDERSLSCFWDEFLFLSSCPTTFIKKPLIFVHNPVSNSEFLTTEFPDILKPNSGKYTLRPDQHVNQEFLMTENRCCNIFASLQAIKKSKDSKNSLMQAIVDHLVYLNQQKGLQWAQCRRGRTARGLPTLANDEARLPLIVNSGNCLFSKYSFSSNDVPSML